ncbi:hypothetical protein GGR56DRAFT_287449 [Xylariaceae sp. FL0804]|nr:hypothetical protein GGR56DRAFT_287449 [Xylariaceae sp. FL0804]
MGCWVGGLAMWSVALALTLWAVVFFAAAQTCLSATRRIAETCAHWRKGQTPAVLIRQFCLHWNGIRPDSQLQAPMRQSDRYSQTAHLLLAANPDIPHRDDVQWFGHSPSPPTRSVVCLFHQQLYCKLLPRDRNGETDNCGRNPTVLRHFR